jgi:hypothetical protein
VINALPTLNDFQLEWLGKFCACDGRSTLDDTIAIEAIFCGLSQEDRPKLVECYDSLINAGLIKVAEGKTEFAGSEFDGIYAKYYARTRRKIVNIRRTGIDSLLLDHLSRIVLKFSKMSEIRNVVAISYRNQGRAPIVLARGSGARLKELVELISNDSIESQQMQKLSSIDLARLFDILRFENRAYLHILDISVSAANLNRNIQFHIASTDGEGIEGIPDQLSLVAQRAAEIGWTFDFTRLIVGMPSIESVDGAALMMGEDGLSLSIEFHNDEFIRAYSTLRDPKRAAAHAMFLVREIAQLDDRTLNNLGYFFLATGDVPLALDILEHSVKVGVSGIAALRLYNLACVRMKMGNYADAVVLLRQVKAMSASPSGTEDEALCLLSPKVLDSQLTFSEVWQCRISELCDIALEACSQLAGDSTSNAGE